MSKNDFMSMKEFLSKHNANTLYGIRVLDYKTGEDASKIISEFEERIAKYVSAYRDFVLMSLYQYAEIKRVRVKENDGYIRTDYEVTMNKYTSTFTRDDFLYKEVRYIYHVRLWEKNNECEDKNEDE